MKGADFVVDALAALLPNSGQDVLKKALEQPRGGSAGGGLAWAVEKAKAERSRPRTGPYKHLMTGVSYISNVSRLSRFEAIAGNQEQRAGTEVTHD